MADSTSKQILGTMVDTGISTSDRVTSNRSYNLSGLKPGGSYEYSVNSGQSWISFTAPLETTSALRFDGQNDFVSIPDNTLLPSGNSSYTLEAWIKPDAMGDRGIIGWGPWGTTSSVNALRLMGNGSIRHYWWSNDLDVNVGNLADGNWHHVAATFDGTTRKVYVDGVLKGSDVPKQHKVPSKATNVRIGSTNNGEYFQGTIDDAAIWTRALTQDEITQRLSTPPNPNDKDLALLYTFNEGNGNSTAAVGSSANGLNGTLTNGPTWTTRDIPANQSAGSTTFSVQLPDGNYADGQFKVRERGSQDVMSAAAFSIDTTAPIVKLNQPGGTDATISTKSGDSTISGIAQPGQPVKLLSRVGTVTSGNLRITSDNAADIYLNGELVGSTTDWTKPYDFTGLKVKSGNNVLAILAYDVGGIAGLSGTFTVPSGKFGTSNISGWKVFNADPEPLTDNSTASRNKSLWNLPANWTSTDFDDSAWTVPVDVRAKTGQYPWGNVSGDPTWIWSADPINQDVALFRYSFNGTNGDEGLQTIADNIEVAKDGSFSYALTADQIKLLGQGQGKSIVAVQSDIAGNIGRSSETPFKIDTEIGAVKITSVGNSDGKVSTDQVEVGKGPLKFQLDQYTGYWSSKLADLQAYVKNYNPSTSKNRISVTTDIIDYTDDRNFNGDFKSNRRWPAAEVADYWGTGGVNDQFFVKISADFYINDATKYRFKTYNDDGVFLLVDDKLVINDPTLHPVRAFTGDIDLQSGNHKLELFFFENGGQASLEFSASRFDPLKNSWGAYQLVGQDPLIKSKSDLQTNNVITGEAEPNSVVSLTLSGKALGAAQADSSGKFSYALSNKNLADIANAQLSGTVVATITDDAGNTSSSAPAPISVPNPVPNVKILAVGGSDLQVSSNTNDRLVEGIGAASLPTIIYFGDTKLAQTTTDVYGNFSYGLTSDDLKVIGQGSGKQIWVEQVTPANIRGKSSIISFSVDTLAPQVVIDSVGLGSGKLSRTYNRIEGRGEPNGTLDLSLGDSPLATVDVDAQGRFTYALPAQFLDRIAANPQLTLKASQIDSAGNRGEAVQTGITAKLSSPDFSGLTIGGTDAVVSSQDGDAQLNGVAQPGLDIAVVYNGKQLQAKAKADNKGLFSATLTPLDLATIGQGNSRVLTLQQLDDYGNLGQATTTPFSVDTLAPQILIPQVGNVDRLGGSDTTISTQANDSTISGKSEPGTLVLRYGTEMLARLEVGSDGIFNYTLTDQNIGTIGQGKDKTLRFEQTDLAGNLGLAEWIGAVDTLAPEVFVDSVGLGGGKVSRTYNRIEGRGEPDRTVSLFLNDVLIGTSDVNAQGKFAHLLSTQALEKIASTPGGSLKVVQTDAAGNRGESRPSLISAKLSPPTFTRLSIGGDDRVVSSQVGDAQVSGVADPGFDVVVLYNGKPLKAKAKADEKGLFSAILTSEDLALIGQGSSRFLTLQQLDDYGNLGQASTMAFSVDTLAPQISLPQVGDTNGLGGIDGVISTQFNDSTIIGKSEQGTVVLKYGSEVLAQVQVGSDGLFSYKLTDQNIASIGQGDGKQLRLEQTDAAGNLGVAQLTVAVDTVPPDAPSLSSVAGDGIVSGRSGDNLIQGTALPGSAVSLLVNGREIAVVKALSNGQFRYPLSATDLAAIGEGNASLIAEISDAAGNKGRSDAFSFVIDTIAPAQPLIQSIGGDDSIVSTRGSGSVTQTVDNIIKGSAEASATVQFYSGTRLLGQTQSLQDGSFVYALTEPNLVVLGQGDKKSLQAVAIDRAGNTSISSQGFSFSIDTIAPLAPKLTSVGGFDAVISSQAGDNIISGTAEPLSQVELRAYAASIDPMAADSKSMFSISLNSDTYGKWSYAFNDEQLTALERNGSTSLLAVASDLAGNQSKSVPFDFKVDRTAPSLTLSPIGGADITISTVAGDSLIRGTAEANRWLSIAYQGIKITDVKAGLDGSFSYNLNSDNLRLIGEGRGKQLQISQQDAAGNSSQLVSLPFNIDVTAPGKALIRSLGGTDNIVSSPEADRVLRGSGEAGSTLEVIAVAGTTRTLLGRQTVGADGSFAYTLSPENLSVIGRGLGKSIVATLSDAAGNKSTSDPFGFQVEALWATGTDDNNKLAFASGVDALTGKGGIDTFIIPSLGTVLMSTSLVPGFDRIVDLAIGVDRIDAPTAIPAGQIRDLGKVQGLTDLAIGSFLTPQAFPANSAAVFSYSDINFGTRTFLAMNDGTAGFKPQSDGIVEITGYTGSLSSLGLI